ncbi:unnamed protein product [Rhizoctonia solani]|uniref:Uncharacterized protein n=1 Tax=Rhizoctonia solani TaxID=456999 RepID=A0A8H3GMX8_9AGAM|nr:unnamed protein product [Rhizoctonia solani]
MGLHSYCAGILDFNSMHRTPTPKGFDRQCAQKTICEICNVGNKVR